MMDDFILSVTSLNRYICSVVEEDENLKNVIVKGEISNFKNHWQSGHFYFVLKDERSEIRCAMFKSSNQRLKFMPEDAMNVICRGRIGYYDSRGEISLYVDEMQPDGIGALSVAFEQMKKRLENEGLFEQSHKKKLPEFPKKIGVVTSESGAVVRDIINVIGRRYPLAEIVVCNVSVQGDESAKEISDAIKLFNEKKAADVLIVGRGGGSVEDLWSFNEEMVARAIYESYIPVVSAVGHETDFTISDFVADLRAPTPSAAAELVVPETEILKSGIMSSLDRMRLLVGNNIHSREVALDGCTLKMQKFSPDSYIDNRIVRNDYLRQRMDSLVSVKFTDIKNGLDHMIYCLSAYNPLNVLSRGYCVVSQNGKIITDGNDVSKGDMIKVRFENNSIDCEVL